MFIDGLQIMQKDPWEKIAHSNNGGLSFQEIKILRMNSGIFIV